MTINQNAKLKISLLPLAIVILLILSAGFLLLSNEFNITKVFRKNTIRRIDGFPTIVYTSNNVEKQRSVIKNQQELAEILNKVDSTGLLKVNGPINFDREYLIAVSTETKEKTGISIKIRKIEEDKENNKLKVFIRETELEENCEIELDKNLALDIVAISKTDIEIEFDREKRTEPCN